MFPDYPFDSHYLSTPAGRLHYLDEGQGPVVVMLHGNPTWSFYYRHLVQALSDRFRVIVPDHLGCGLSDKPQSFDYSLEQHVKNLELLLDHLQVTRLSLVLHDWGGAIGMGYATRHSKRVHQLVILNTAAFRSTRIPLRIRICRWPLLGPLLVRGCNGFARAAVFMAVAQPMAKPVAAAYLAPYNSWHNRVAIHRFVQDIPLSSSHPSYAFLAAIEAGLAQFREQRTPMLIIWGGKDFCFNDSFYNEWQRRFPAADCHYLHDVGHYVLEDGHGTVEPLIAAFLTDGIQGKP